MSENSTAGSTEQTTSGGSNLRFAVGVIFDGVLAGLIAVLAIRAGIGLRPVELPTGASSLGVVLLASLVFACGIALSLRSQIAAHGDPVGVNALILGATAFASSLILLPVAGVDLPNWTLGPGDPFLGTAMLSVVVVFALLYGAFALAISDSRLLLRRGGAAAIDGILALILTIAVVWVLAPALWRPGPTGATEGEVIGVFLALLVCSMLVRLPFEAYNGGSIGKYLTGIRVTNTAGKTPTVMAVCLRNLLRPVDSLPVGYIVGVGWSSATDSNQRLGDLLAGTRVQQKDD